MNVVLLRHYKNGQTERTITSFNTPELALINLYGNMRASVGDANCARVTCQLMDDDGNVTKCERYVRSIEPVIDEPKQEES